MKADALYRNECPAAVHLSCAWHRASEHSSTHRAPVKMSEPSLAITFSVWMKIQLQVEHAQFTSAFLENPTKQLLNLSLSVNSFGTDSFYLR